MHYCSPFILSSPSPLLLDEESDPEVAELDLGTKIKTPKEVMLEELSLLKNKGSKMFKMRQQRVDKFIVANENLVSVKKRRVCGVYVCVVIYNIYYFIFQQNLQNLLMSPPPVPPKPEVPKEEGRVTDVLFITSVPFQCLKGFLSLKISRLPFFPSLSLCLSGGGESE